MTVSKLEKEDIFEIELELTGTCNLNCPLCTRNYVNAQHLLKYNERPLQEIIAQLDEYPNLKSCCMAGIISEPTLYKDFFRLIEYFVGRGIQLEIYSNASLHSEEWWAKLAGLLSPQDLVFFTVCGSTQELHEKYRVGSSLSKVLENHMAFKKACPYPIDTLQYIRFDYNAEDFNSPATLEIRKRFSKECNIDTLPYNERFGFIDDESNRIRLTAELARAYHLISTFGKNRYEQSKAGNLSCKMRCNSLESRFIAIDQFGAIFPCFLYRIYNTNEQFNLDYEKINKFQYSFCYECESTTTHLLEQSKLQRMS